MVNPPIKNERRKTWDPVSKREVANDILDGKISVSDVRRLHKVQPYQLYAWIGQAAVARMQQQESKRKAPAASPTAAVGKLSASELLELAEVVSRIQRRQ